MGLRLRLAQLCPECGAPYDAARRQAVAALVLLVGLAPEATRCRCGQGVWVRRGGRRVWVDPLWEEASMKPRWVEFTIHEDGTWESDAVGFEGRACQDVAAPLEQALGRTTERTLKPEARRPARTPRRTVRR